jgi:hypothetical protein
MARRAAGAARGVGSVAGRRSALVVGLAALATVAPAAGIGLGRLRGGSRGTAPAAPPGPAGPTDAAGAAHPADLAWRLLTQRLATGRPNARLGLVQAQHIFARAAGLPSDPVLRARVADAAAGADNDLRVSLLTAANTELRRVLIELHAMVEESNAREAVEINQAIWAFLRESTQRRAINIG